MYKLLVLCVSIITREDSEWLHGNLKNIETKSIKDKSIPYNGYLSNIVK